MVRIEFFPDGFLTLIKGAYRTLYVNRNVKFDQIQNAILDRLTDHRDHSGLSDKNEINSIFGLRYVEPSSVIYHRGRTIWIHPRVRNPSRNPSGNPSGNPPGNPPGKQFILSFLIFPDRFIFRIRLIRMAFRMAFRMDF